MSIRKVSIENNPDRRHKPKKKKHGFKSLTEDGSKLNQDTHNTIKSPYSTRNFVQNTTPINSLIEKCNEFQQKLEKTREALMKDIQETLEPKTIEVKYDKIFHKSKFYTQKKQKIKENVAIQKYNSSAKLQKIKSVIDTNYKDGVGKEFVTTEDITNEEAASYLNINKRQFGQAKQEIIFREKKRKTLKLYYPTKSQTKISGLPEITPRSAPRNYSNDSKSNEKPVAKSPSNYFITSEMKKLWPQDTELINEKKRNILKMKIEKLQSIIEEKSNSIPIEDEIIGGQVNLVQKFKMDTMIHLHIRSLRKKLTINT
jgi:hypothetical protein